MNTEQTKGSDKYLVIFVIVAIIILALSVLLTISDFWGWDLSKAAQTGDSIGGITSPLVNLLAAFLIYISFREQITANKSIQKQLDLQVGSQLYEEYKELVKVKSEESNSSESGYSIGVSQSKSRKEELESFFSRMNQYIPWVSNHGGFNYEEFFNEDGLFAAFLYLETIHQLVQDFESEKLINKKFKRLLFLSIKRDILPAYNITVPVLAKTIEKYQSRLKEQIRNRNLYPEQAVRDLEFIPRPITWVLFLYELDKKYDEKPSTNLEDYIKFKE